MNKEISIYIDGKEIKTVQSENLLKVARENGIEIPGLCWHPRLSPTGACRLCGVKIEGMRGIVMSCTIEAQDGMKITAFDPELEHIRKNNLDFMLSEHNEDSDPSYFDEFAPLIDKYNLRN
ncbi:MAG TPA: 2Fe-2S iron-sulfur cluster binding domain-containing protein, partial [Bacteroidetes bacterium]|nr:2Fe-2S iron-sulfur cluster binding domain-containing protein [Bacteroidota bacterium]